MNLRENKMDKYEPKKKSGGFLGFFSSQKRIEGSNSQKIEESKIKKIEETKAKRIPAPHIKMAAYVQSKDEKWTHQKTVSHIAPEKLDFQEKFQHISEHSRYLQEKPDDVLVHWRGPDFEHYPHDKQWYIGALCILCAIIVYAIFTDSIIMAIVFGLIGLTGYQFLTSPQKEIDFAITYDGVLVGDEIYDFDHIKSFWIFYEPPHTRIISLHMQGHFRPYLHIPLHQIDPVIVHEKLSGFIPEIKQEESLVDIAERLLRM